MSECCYFSEWILNLKCKCWTTNFCIHASKSTVIIVNQLKSVQNSSFKDLHSHPIHTHFR